MKDSKSESQPVAAKKVAAEVVVNVEPVAAAKPLGKAARKPVAKKAVVSEVKAAKEVKAPKAEKKPKLKVVRDSFTMPQSEYQKIAELKELCLKDGLQVKKSEVLRAGLKALCAMDAQQIKLALSGLDKIKTGRPNKH